MLWLLMAFSISSIGAERPKYLSTAFVGTRYKPLRNTRLTQLVLRR